MKLEIKKIIYLLLLVTFLKGLVWLVVVPIWHTPDEQAHFAEVEFIAEKKRLPSQVLNRQSGEKELSREILFSEQLLGTERDEAGINKFTYHPEYNIPYESGLVGKYEKEINNIPKSWRSEMVRNESANYPPLYYLLGSLVYFLFYSGDLFTRVMMVRIFSILLSTLTVFFSFKIAKEIFPKDFLLQLAIPLLVSFQPMFTFVSVGVNSDNLLNLLFTAFIYLGIKIIREGLTLKSGLFLGMVVGLGIITRPQLYLLAPLALALFVFEAVRERRQLVSLCLKFGLFVFFLIAAGGWWFLRLFFLSNIPMLVDVSAHPDIAPPIPLLDYLEMALTKLIRETIPWYWGVFKWLGLVLPRLVNRILMRVTLLAALGSLIWFVKVLLRRKFTTQEISLFFLILINFLYIGAIYQYDFSYLRLHGMSIGIQGRYFFPAISAQMTFLVLGIVNLIPQKWLKLQKSAIILLTLGMIVLNFVALGTIFWSYYPVNNISQAVNWVSQYKPWFFKGNYLIGLLLIYLGGLSFFLKEFLKKTLKYGNWS